MVGTSSSNAAGAGSIPGRGARIPHASQPRGQGMKGGNAAASSIKTLKVAHIKEKSF